MSNNLNNMNNILPLLQAASHSAAVINQSTNAQRIGVTAALAAAINDSHDTILTANQLDLAAADTGSSFYDRLLLTPERITQIAAATHQISLLHDPVGQTLLDRVLPNGLRIKKITVPLGVVGAIYEARPNVTIDIAALCLRSGNGVVLKGGSDAAHSNAAIVAVIHEVLQAHGLPTATVTLLPNEREHVAAFLTAQQYIDVIVPRGSQQLINFVRQHATVPTIETGAGVCHTYVETSANLHQAAAIVINAKTQRPTVCNALDTVLVDAAIAPAFLPMLIPGFEASGVGVYADAAAHHILAAHHYAQLHHATAESFGREYLSQNCAIKLVAGIDEAMQHIQQYGSKHSEAIITETPTLAERFLQQVDAAAVYHNASTRFTDGGEFGLGAELGISTQKLHARGPFALEKMVCEKWLVSGHGHIR